MVYKLTVFVSRYTISTTQSSAIFSMDLSDEEVLAAVRDYEKEQCWLGHCKLTGDRKEKETGEIYFRCDNNSWHKPRKDEDIVEWLWKRTEHLTI